METMSSISNSPSARHFSGARIGPMMKSLRYVVPMLIVSAALTSCLGQSSNATTHVRGINLITDGPLTEFTVDGTDVSSAEYGSMGPVTAAGTGTHTLGVAIVTPSNLITQPQQTYTPFGSTVNEDMTANLGYTVIAYGTMADTKYLVMANTALTNAPATDTATYQVVDAAPNSPPLDIYITAPEAGITVARNIGGINYGQSSTEGLLNIVMPPGLINTSTTLTVNITIELRSPTTGVSVIPPTTITASALNRVLFVIADNIGPGASPVVIDALVSTTGAAASGNLLANPADVAELAFANVSVDSPPFTIFGGLSLQQTLAADIAYTQKSAYADVPSGVAGTIAALTSDPTQFKFLVSFTSTPNASYTEYAVGPFVPIESFTTVQGLVLLDDRRSVPVQGELRFVNAAWSLQYGPTVDIYTVPHDQGLNIAPSNGNRPPPNYPSVAYKASTAYTQLLPGAYDLYMAYSGTSSIIMGPVELVVKDGGIVTYVLTNDIVGSGEDYVLIPFNDARPL